jgi:hypothetical protein
MKVIKIDRYSRKKNVMFFYIFCQKSNEVQTPSFPHWIFALNYETPTTYEKKLNVLIFLTGSKLF